MAVEDILQGPGKTALEKGEFVECILLDSPAPRSGDAYLRFTPRTEMDIAVVGVSVQLTLDEHGVIASARVALGAVGPKVVRADAAEQLLVGHRLDDETLEALAAACSEASHPIDDKRGTVAFRKQVAGVLARRAASQAYARAGGTQ
jgi:carbon-monoxide dehydrogenase medium subunit